jgi:hypothetical protein
MSQLSAEIWSRIVTLQEAHAMRLTLSFACECKRFAEAEAC